MLLDDDVSVDRFCVAEHVAAYKDGFFDAVQGKVLAGVDPEGQPANMARLTAEAVAVQAELRAAQAAALRSS